MKNIKIIRKEGALMRETRTISSSKDFRSSRIFYLNPCAGK